ncbi:MAG: hypothetical protein M3313_01270 [Actinomycetota bacterium]|nr:hypothetical protein [Actinomycetota bacterium]
MEYLDPLIVSGGPPSRASDVWALGAMLHRALAGIGLYGELPDNRPLLAIRKVMSAQPMISGDLPRGASALIRACLDSPERRPPTAGAVAQWLIDLARSEQGIIGGG